jgi:hypothetical protein
MEKLSKLDFLNVLQADAERLIAARNKARFIHKSGDIDASGDEVEQPVRQLFSDKLPGLCHVGHGHIVDASHTVSPQLDVIIADRAATPILFRGENGTEYVPYECIYAIGETKTSYSKTKKPIHRFSDTIRRIRSELKRAKTPTNYLGNGIALGEGFALSDNRPYKNPLFSFMLFVGGDHFGIADVRDLYKTELPENLPNVVCILDQGLLLYARMQKQDGGHYVFKSINLIPEFATKTDEQENRWAFVPYGDNSNRPAMTFGVLWFLLMEHLRSCLLSEPRLMQYISDLISFEAGEVIA